jgi:hypothetical protein
MKASSWRKHFYIWSIVALSFKSIGASWDVAFHFKYLREFYQLPHILNGVGNILLFCILVYAWRRETRETRRGLNISLAGMGFFLFGIGFDQWWHSWFGLDITIWSPAHSTLYLATFIAVVGLLVQALSDAKRGLISAKTKLIIQYVFFFLLFDCFWFLLTQQEQAVIAYGLIERGTPLASPELIAAIARSSHVTLESLRVALYGVPPWVYAAWGTLGAFFTFRLMKYFDLGKYSSTIIVIAYLAVRLVMNTIFSVSNYQTSVIPYYLLALALSFDLAFDFLSLRTHQLFTSLIMGFFAVIVFYGAFLLNGYVQIIPPLIQFPEVLLVVPTALLSFLLATGAFRVILKSYK